MWPSMHGMKSATISAMTPCRISSTSSWMCLRATEGRGVRGAEAEVREAGTIKLPGLEREEEFDLTQGGGSGESIRDGRRPELLLSWNTTFNDRHRGVNLRCDVDVRIDAVIGAEPSLAQSIQSFTCNRRYNHSRGRSKRARE